ncbi:small subunit ribosomal protein S3 [Ferrithrix thermotolerans DSM 19514]|jgi:small subunit ribosomal protein S3|uniref:Small ribosomal subunit protein uS3 n=1 Tax=Ferrithrix thermotolerans DSM 19514 TaxID=1121881 RepID=A0A1M4SSH4_9ACTN|nr:30S ribosomal protein S3 [Ferrithrix thermotolerans]SHE35204.1 small subunit ribosomal protein S3 [Ferrithrix thermotolerans DSM 19514]
MGQKVNPYGFRLGVTTDWKSRWFDERHYQEWIVQDYKIRKYLMEELETAAVSKVEIERTRDRLKVDIHTARPGIVIGKKGSEAERLRQHLAALTGNPKVQINIEEIKHPELDATLVAQGIADQLSRRVSFRRAMKRAIQVVEKSGGQGVTVMCSGRLGGAEMARKESYREGRVPRHTLRANIDYGFREARTTFGRIGVKVWIYKGDILPYKTAVDERAVSEGNQGADKPRRVITAGGGKRRPEQAGVVVESSSSIEERTGLAPAEILEPKDAETDALERLLQEEEEIERRTKDSAPEAPHFKREVD